MIFHALTAVLVVLKLLGMITIGWFFVVLPSLIGLFVLVSIMIIAFLLGWLANK